jgi:hypothetical protein
MTQTSPEASEHVSSRQRRIEEQRRKIDSARRDQRRQRLVWVGAAVALAVVAIVLVVLFLPRPAPETMRQVATETGSHVDPGTPLTYRSRPPSSGPHYGALPQPTDYRMYDQSITPGLWVHMLEHGSIVALYRPDLCDQACMTALTDFFDSAPRDQSFGLRKLAVLPYTNMDHAVAVVAWGYVDEMDAAQVDKNRMLADYKLRIDKGPETAI